jgi:hypothetical protein
MFRSNSVVVVLLVALLLGDSRYFFHQVKNHISAAGTRNVFRIVNSIAVGGMNEMFQSHVNSSRSIRGPHCKQILQ